MKKPPSPPEVLLVDYRVRCHARLEEQRDALRRLLSVAQAAQEKAKPPIDNVLTFEKVRA